LEFLCCLFVAWNRGGPSRAHIVILDKERDGGRERGVVFLAITVSLVVCFSRPRNRTRKGKEGRKVLLGCTWVYFD
jgi:hypothetical protein